MALAYAPAYMTQILDCTLRDGGYYTDWDFDPEDVRQYLHSVARLPISYVEVGYVNDPGSAYTGEYNYLTPERLREIRGILRDDQKLVVMIDGKNMTPERLPALFGGLTDLVDLVRITVAPAAMEHGVGLARALKQIGLRVGLNVMYLSTFQHDLGKIQTALDAPDAFDSLALVDSYGGCLPSSVGPLFTELRGLLPDKIIGYHGHDNMCLAFANTLAAIDNGADVVDGTFAGMGRGAGNLRTETVLIHMAGQDGGELDYSALSRAVAPFEKLRPIYEWGTNLPYMLSGANNLPQKDVMDWLGKNRYSVLSIIDALRRQSGAEADTADRDALAPDSFGTPRAVLLIGGGESVVRHVEALARFVAKNDPLIVFSTTRHIGLASQLGGTQLLCLPGHDAAKVSVTENLGGLAGLVVPTPPRVPDVVPEGVGTPVFQAEPVRLSDDEKIGPVSDTGPLALALGAVRALGAREVFLAGFDGYPTASGSQQELSREVEATIDRFRETAPDVELRSVTPTRYAVAQGSVYGLIAAVD
jgi:4-hydroxy 2-oxovalerate aldolase